MNRYSHLVMVVDLHHEDTMANVECVHILLQGFHCICPQDVSPGFVSQRTLETCVKSLQHLPSLSLHNLHASTKLMQQEQSLLDSLATA